MPYRGGLNAGEQRQPDTRDDVERAPYNDAANDGATTPQNTERARVEPDRKQLADRRRKPHAERHDNQRRIAVVSTQASNGDQTRAATPDTGAVRRNSVVMIEAITTRTRRGRQGTRNRAGSTPPDECSKVVRGSGTHAHGTPRRNAPIGQHEEVRSDPRNVGAQRRNEERATTRARERR